MADNNATDTTEDGQRKQVHSEMELEALPSWGPTKAKGRLAKGTRVRESLENGRGREVLPNTKKAKKSYKNKPSNNNRRYRSTSSSSSTEKSSPSPKKHKS